MESTTEACVKEWEVGESGLVSNHKALELYKKRIPKPIKIKEGRNKQKFPQRYTDGQDMKRCSASLIISKMKIKTIMRYNRPAVKLAYITKSKSNQC